MNIPYSWYPAVEQRLSPDAMLGEPAKSGHVCRRCTTLTPEFVEWDFVSSPFSVTVGMSVSWISGPGEDVTDISWERACNA